MSNFGIQRITTKQNQQFNELLVNNINAKEIRSVSENDLLINSYYKNQSNYQNNSKVIINNGILINTKGDLLISRNLQLLDINSFENPINLYNDENNLIWGTDVVVTDATLQSEIENLKIDNLKSNQLTLLSNINQKESENQISLKVSNSIHGQNEGCSYSIILPSRKPKRGDILVVIDDQGNTDWISLSNIKIAF